MKVLDYLNSRTQDSVVSSQEEMNYDRISMICSFADGGKVAEHSTIQFSKMH